MIYLLTPTGGRQAGLIYLARYIREQTYSGPMNWLIVDDCDPRTLIPKMPSHVTVWGLRPGWRWDGKNTQSRCLRFGLDSIGDDSTVLIMEDDDVYLPQHIENLVQALEENELVGERLSRYYNVATHRYRTIPGTHHASLCSTGVRGEALVALRRVVQHQVKRIDSKLWRGFKGKKVLLDSENVVGIKGLPGRPGIGVGHKEDFGQPDEAGVLEQWIGPDRAARYSSFRKAS